jgi:heme-degrading monooxygenase HmoA
MTAPLPTPGKAPLPAWAVIFISQRTAEDQGYAAATERMRELGTSQPGFLGIESARTADGKGITVVFYDSEESASAWGRNPEHRQVQSRGRDMWYTRYAIYYARVERGHSWTRRE